MNIKFERDNTKAIFNIKKHGVSFEEAETVFCDPLACIFDDEWHSIEEEREIIIGHSSNNQLLIVCFAERAGNIRIFSARPATRKERRNYEEKTNF
ncbi:MAG: BrnT family toxin [bacterium]|nr:BrnT family toxin [bacterium]